MAFNYQYRRFELSDTEYLQTALADLYQTAYLKIGWTRTEQEEYRERVWADINAVEQELAIRSDGTRGRPAR